MQGQGPDWENLTHQVQHLVRVLPPKILTPHPYSIHDGRDERGLSCARQDVLRVLCDSAGSMLALLREDRDCASRQHVLMGPGAIPDGDRRKGPDYKSE